MYFGGTHSLFCLLLLGSLVTPLRLPWVFIIIHCQSYVSVVVCCIDLTLNTGLNQTSFLKAIQHLRIFFEVLMCPFLGIIPKKEHLSLTNKLLIKRRLQYMCFFLLFISSDISKMYSVHFGIQLCCQFMAWFAHLDYCCQKSSVQILQSKLLVCYLYQKADSDLSEM